jgi:hypothetical protein
MSLCSSWIHGNALVLESPLYFNPSGEQTGRLVVTPFGWGAQVSIEGHPRPSWVHLPIPTTNSPVSQFERFELVRVFLLGECSDATIDDVHIYDGNHKIAEFQRTLQGSFLAQTSKNTFELPKPHRMRSGVGISFFFNSAIGFEQQPSPGTLIVCAAGAEFQKTSRFFDTLLDPFRRRGP